MAKTAQAQTIERTQTGERAAQPSAEVELSTGQLVGGDLDTEIELHDLNLNTTDWLALLSTGPIHPEQVEKTPNPIVQPKPLPSGPLGPSGMVEHATPPRMKLTVASRLSIGAKRGALMLALGGLAIGAVAAGAYVLSSTPWVASLLSPTAPSSPPANIDASTNGLELAGNDQTIAAPMPFNATSIELRDRGVKEYQAGDYSASIDLLQSALDLNGRDAIASYQLGLAYMASNGREHALEDAEMAFRTAISLQPAWAAPHQLLAESLVRRGFYEDAVAPALEATQLDATQAEAWMTLGRAYRGADKPTEARDAFAQAARQAPALPPNQP